MYVRPGQHTSVMPRDNHFLLSCLRKLFKLRLQYKIPDTEDQDTEDLKKEGMQNVHTRLKFVQLRWTGHDPIMPDE